MRPCCSTIPLCCKYKPCLPVVREYSCVGPGAGHVKGLAKRVIACLDVRANDAGDLVVTKGDQYNVRETDGTGREVWLSRSRLKPSKLYLIGLSNLSARWLAILSPMTFKQEASLTDTKNKERCAVQVRNLGAPVELAGRYFSEGADEVTFLNITGFRDFPLGDLPMLEVGLSAAQLRAAHETLRCSFLARRLHGRAVLAMQQAPGQAAPAQQLASVGPPALLLAQQLCSM